MYLEFTSIALFAFLHVAGHENKWCTWEKSWVHFHVNECAEGSSADRAWVVRVILCKPVWRLHIPNFFWSEEHLNYYYFFKIKLNLTSVKMKLGSAAGGCRKTPLFMFPPFFLFFCSLRGTQQTSVTPFQQYIYSICHIFFPPCLQHFSPRILAFFFSGSNGVSSGGPSVRINMCRTKAKCMYPSSRS